MHSRRRLTLFLYGFALFSFGAPPLPPGAKEPPSNHLLFILFCFTSSFVLGCVCTVAVNMMLGYYVYVEMRAFNVVITGADRTAKLPAHERSLFRSPDVADADVENYVQRRAFTDLIDKIDDLGQTIRLLIQRSASASPVRPGTLYFTQLCICVEVVVRVACSQACHERRERDQCTLLLTRPNLPDTIALVTPITSKGKIMDVESMPLFSVSVPSLCETASSGYHYTYFLCYTQGDSVFGDAAVVQHHFDQVGPASQPHRSSASVPLLLTSAEQSSRMLARSSRTAPSAADGAARSSRWTLCWWRPVSG